MNETLKNQLQDYGYLWKRILDKQPVLKKKILEEVKQNGLNKA